VYLAMRGTDGKLAIAKIRVENEAWTTNWYRETNSLDSQAYSLRFGRD